MWTVPDCSPWQLQTLQEQTMLAKELFEKHFTRYLLQSIFNNGDLLSISVSMSSDSTAVLGL